MNNHEIKTGFKEIYPGENIIDANTSRGVLKIHLNEQWKMKLIWVTNDMGSEID